MYNEKIKQRWIEEKNNSNVVLPDGALIRSFNKMEPFEAKLEKDLCNFTVIEIIDIYKTLSSVTFETLHVMNSYFKQYTDFCILNNIAEIETNSYAGFKPSDLRSFVNAFAMENKIVTREQILGYCNKLANSIDKFVLLGLFEGINGTFFSDFVNLTIDDINEKEGTIKVGNRVIEASQELIKYGLEAAVEESYSGVFGESRIAVPYKPSKLIAKNLSAHTLAADDKKRGRRIQNKLSNIFKGLKINEWLLANDIVNSGKIHWLNSKFSSDEIKGIFFFKYRNEDSERNIENFKNQFDISVVRSGWYTKYERYL